MKDRQVEKRNVKVKNVVVGFCGNCWIKLIEVRRHETTMQKQEKNILRMKGGRRIEIDFAHPSTPSHTSFIIREISPSYSSISWAKQMLIYFHWNQQIVWKYFRRKNHKILVEQPLGRVGVEKRIYRAATEESFPISLMASTTIFLWRRWRGKFFPYEWQ